MTREEIRRAVLSALGRIAPDADLSALADTADLREQLDIDSMDHLSFMIAIGEETGVEVPERDYGKLRSLADAIDYVAAHAAR